MNSVKLWQLYILPFIAVFILLSLETLNIKIGGFISFDELAKSSTSVVKIDPESLQKALVVKVIDGDTIEIETGERVRFIGVDTPETVHPKKSIQCYGREASNKMKSLLSNKWIYLEKDVSETDRYGRLLRYIYLPNLNNPTEAIFIDEYLIENGYGKVITYPPDVKYHDKLLVAQKNAQAENRGLWQKCQGNY